MLLGILARVPFSASLCVVVPPSCCTTTACALSCSSSSSSLSFSAPRNRSFLFTSMGPSSGFIDHRRNIYKRRTRSIDHDFRKTTGDAVLCGHQRLCSCSIATDTGSSSSLFSQIYNDNDNDKEDVTNNGDFGKKKVQSNRNQNNTKGTLVSVVSDLLYGANHVHANFLRLSGALYSRTILFSLPFVGIFFVVLPSLVLSSSYRQHTLAVIVQGGLQNAFTILADVSMRFYLHPLFRVVELLFSMFSACFGSSSSKTNTSAWGNNNNYNTSSSRKRFYLLVFLGPIVEELVFRFGFYKLWMLMFRPIPAEKKSDTRSSSGKGMDIAVGNGNDEIEIPVDQKGNKNSKQVVERNRNANGSTYNGNNNTNDWFLASGAVFAITHLVNFFPLDVVKYCDDAGNILLPGGSLGERFLLGLFPPGFTKTHGAFSLVNMVLFGAIFQGMHCFLNTLILYGPLFQKRGLFASIGAHMAWNFNVFWLVSNIQLRLVCRLVCVPLLRLLRQRTSIGGKRPKKTLEKRDEGLN